MQLPVLYWLRHCSLLTRTREPMDKFCIVSLLDPSQWMLTPVWKSLCVNFSSLLPSLPPPSSSLPSLLSLPPPSSSSLSLLPSPPLSLPSSLPPPPLSLPLLPPSHSSYRRLYHVPRSSHNTTDSTLTRSRPYSRLNLSLCTSGQNACRGARPISRNCKKLPLSHQG